MDDDKVMKNAQYRKNLSIGFFNSVNAAIEMVKHEAEQMKKAVFVGGNKDTYLADRVRFWRDLFLEDHKKYYAEVIAQVGVNYVVEDTVAKLQACENLESLQKVWVSLSQDERDNPEIFKVAQEKKFGYEKAQ